VSLYTLIGGLRPLMAGVARPRGTFFSGVALPLSPLQVWRCATAVNYSKLLATSVINNDARRFAFSDVTDDVTDAATNSSRRRSSRRSACSLWSIA